MSEDLYTPEARRGGITGSLRFESANALAMLVALAAGMPLPSLPPQAGAPGQAGAASATREGATMSAIGIPCWSWGGNAPGGWAREYLEWLAHYQRTGVAQDAPSWHVWIEEWPAWTPAERVAHVRLALASLLSGTRHEAWRAHKLRMSAPPPGTQDWWPGSRREWSRLALTARLAARMTLAEVITGQNGSEEVCREQAEL